MGIAGQMKMLGEEIISSYESRISEIADIVNSTYKILEEFKYKREEMSLEIKEQLARSESLRRKDFNIMMKEIIADQDQREKEVKQELEEYIREQKELAATLKQVLAKGESVRLDEFKALMEGTRKKQSEREIKTKKMLQNFQKEQEELSLALKEMLAKGEALRIKDFKRMLRNIKDRQKEREKEVEGMLNEYGAEHEEAAQSWQAFNSAMVEKRSEVKEVMSR
jgi:nucleoid DNA-binding protein